MTGQPPTPPPPVETQDIASLPRPPVQTQDIASPPTPPVETQNLASLPVPPAPRRSYRWVIFLMLGVLGLALVCVAVVVALVANNLSHLPANLGANQSLLDDFMRAGVRQDARAAFALFSSRGQQHTPLGQIEKMFSNDNRALFKGYERLEVTFYGVHTGSAAQYEGIDLPDGSFIVVRGAVHYDDGMDGTFSAALEQMDQDTKLYSFSLAAPPSRFRNNQNG